MRKLPSRVAGTSHALEGVGGPGHTHPEPLPSRHGPSATTAPGRHGSPPRPGHGRWSPGRRRHGRGLRRHRRSRRDALGARRHGTHRSAARAHPDHRRSDDPTGRAPARNRRSHLRHRRRAARRHDGRPTGRRRDHPTQCRRDGRAPPTAGARVLVPGRTRTRRSTATSEPGETVDLLGTFGSGPGASTSVLARKATVLAVQSSGRATIGSGGDLVLTVALGSADAVLDVAHAARVADLTVIRATRAGDDGPTRDTVQTPGPASGNAASSTGADR